MPPRTDGRPLSGRCAVVLGATGRLGALVADALAGAGSGVVLHTRRREAEARAAADELSARHGVPALAVRGDVTDPAAMAAVRSAVEAGGFTRVDALVSCLTAYDGRPRPVGELPVEDFRRVVDVDLVGPFVAVQALLPLLRAGSARVLLMSSLVGSRGRPAAAHLCAAKAGLTGLALALAHELGPEGVTVNCVAPGALATAGGGGHTPGPHAPPVLTDAADVAALLTLLAAAPHALQAQQLVLNGGRP